jgi:hypothetical protein
MRRRSGSLFHRYPKPKENNKGFVTLRGLAIYIKKKYLQCKKKTRTIMEIQIFHHAKI